MNARKAMFSKIMIALFAALFVALCHGQAVAAPGLSMHDGLYVLTLEGDPYEIGFQQGTLMKDQIQQVYKMYLNDLVYDKWIKEYAILGKGGKDAWKSPKKSLARFSKNLEENIPEDYRKEMQGIADAAGLEYIDVLNMSAHVDYFAILCSTLVASGKATTDGKLVEARNLDWAQGGLQELDKLSTVFVIRPKKGHAFVSVIYPGIVGVLTAVNDAKITAELNFSMATDNGKSGIPALILMRDVIQNAGTLDEAEAILRNAKRFAGYNITITDGKTNEARLIEVSYGAVGTKNIENGTLISTNHFITKELAGKNVKASNFSSSPSEERFDRLSVLMKENYGKIEPKLAGAMIHDDGVKVPGTVQTVVFKPADETIWVWSRNRGKDNFIQLDVAKLLSGKDMASTVK